MQSVQEPSGLVIDIGGGSTEFVFYADNTVKSVFSLPIGSLTAYTTYVKTILPSKKEEKLIAEAIREAAADLPKERPEVICGVGGSIRAAVKIYNELFEDTLPAGRVELKKLQTLLKIPQDTLAKAILKVSPERIHTFIPGLILLCTVAEMWDITKISVSTSGVTAQSMSKAVRLSFWAKCALAFSVMARRNSSMRLRWMVKPAASSWPP